MSPEQIRGEQLDQRTDLYSLGATYYTLLTGRVPYERDDVIQVLFAHCSALPPDPTAVDPSLPAACGTIIARCLAKEPRDRYSSVRDLQLHLQALLTGESQVETRERKLTLPIRIGETNEAIAQKRQAKHTVARAAVAMTIGLVCLALLGAYQIFVPPANSPRESVKRVLTKTKVRPALPIEGFTIEQPWTATQDGTLKTVGELEFMRLSPDTTAPPTCTWSHRSRASS